MAKQFEDIIDSCLQALYGDKYDFAFLLFFADHSSGHDKKVPMGLNVKSSGSEIWRKERKAI